MSETKGRQERAAVVAKLKEKMEGAKSIVFTEYHGLSATQISDLRMKLKAQGAETSVAKNKLLNIALDNDEVDLKGPTMTVFSYEDAVSVIKTLFDFSKENEKLPAIKAGIVEGRVINADELEVLSNLPSREQLLAQVVGGMKAPLSGFAGVLGGVQRSFVYALSAIAEQKEA